MNIISLEFIGFFIAVFAGYYLLSKVGNKSYKYQNIWLLAVSYLFYGLAEWKMLPLLLVSTGIFYAAGLLIAKYNESNEKRAAFFTTLSVIFGIGVLVYFKYLGFLVDGFVRLFNAIGWQTNGLTLKILMPLGISFFTFRLIAYPLEVRRGHIEPCKDIVAFAAYVAFFPTIMSGPIDRPNKFLPQLQKSREFNYSMAVKGCKLILWGLFMKLCVADRLAIYTNAVFNNFLQHNGTSLLFASLLYPLQMYADFAGYSNLAIGLGSLLGIEVAQNFNRPFFATNVAEYWRRWHMSLTSWLTDYIFMPLNIKFRNWGKFGVILAIVINLVLVGMWHGDNLTFAAFGLYHGLLFIPLIISGAFMKKQKKGKKGQGYTPKFIDVLKMIGTFLLVALGLIIFRADSLQDAFAIVKNIITNPGSLFMDIPTLGYGLLCLMLLVFVDCRDEFFPNKVKLFENKNRVIRWGVYLLLIIMVLSFGVLDSGQFIYFQF